jgi:hypothetical protein
LAAIAPRLSDAKLFDTFQLGHRDKNPTPNTNGRDVTGFDLPAKAPYAYIPETRARVRQRVQAFLNYCAAHVSLLKLKYALDGAALQQ